MVKKADMKKADSGELISDLARTFSMLVYNYNTSGPVKQYDKHCRDLTEELIRRGLMTKEQIVNLLDK